MVKCWSSKSNSWVRFPPTLVILFRNIKNFYIQIISLSFIIFLFLYIDLINRGFFGHKYILILSFFFSIYWIVSIFIFLFKRSNFTSYTSVIQRFWKRSLYLFWILEFFLFFIYLYLVLNCASEIEWMFDQTQLFRSKYFSGNFFFKNILNLFLIIIFTLIAQNNLIYKNIKYVFLFFIFILFLLNTVVFNEFSQIYFYSLYYSGVKWDYDVDNKYWVLITDIDKMRTLYHYTFLILILKFWHTLFIVSFYIIFLMFSIQQKKVFQGGLSSNKQNFYFLFFFGFIMYYWIYKFYLNHVYEYVYTWFYVNKFFINNYFFVVFKNFFLLIL